MGIEPDRGPSHGTGRPGADWPGLPRDQPQRSPVRVMCAVSSWPVRRPDWRCAPGGCPLLRAGDRLRPGDGVAGREGSGVAVADYVVATVAGITMQGAAGGKDLQPAAPHTP